MHVMSLRPLDLNSGCGGKVLEHEVPSFEGDRVCYAYFMRDNVYEWAKVPCCNWMKTDYYE